MLSRRLLLIAKQVNKKDIVCDIGTDHAMIPIYLIKKKIVNKVYACDISKKPLMQAKKNIIKYNVEKFINIILSDGLSWILNIYIDTCIISGVGSLTILKILLKDSNLINRYIFCSNNDSFLLRSWIKKQKYFIENELLIKENNFIYEIIIVNKIIGKEIKNKKDLYFGPFLWKECSKLFKNKWLFKKYYYLSLLKKIPINNKHYLEIKSKLKIISEVI